MKWNHYFFILLVFCSVNASAQLYVTYPTGTNTFTVGTPATSVVPSKAGVPNYGYTSIGSRLDVSPDFLDYPSGIASSQDGVMYVATTPSTGVIRKFTPTGMVPSNDPRTGPYTTKGSGFLSPCQIATDGTYIYVADYGVGLKRINIIANTTATYGTGITKAISVALTKKGELFVGQDGGVVKKISANGATTTVFGPTFKRPYGITVDNVGNVFVSDVLDKTITKLSPFGALLETFTGFTAPMGLTMDNAGNLVIADDRSVKILSPGSISGAVATTLVTRAVGATYFGVAVDAQGLIYGTDDVLSNLTYLVPKGGLFITPALPAGLTFDYNSGAIAGTPLEGSAEKIYTVYGYDANNTRVSGEVTIKVVSGNADLAAISTNVGTLSPTFDKDVLEYNTSVANTSITITPTLSDQSATVTVNGNATVSGVASVNINLIEGLNNIPVVVTASDGTVKNYAIKFTRTIGLSSYTVSSGTLSPVFDPNTYAYTATVQPAISSITITPVANDANYTVKVNNIDITNANLDANIILNDGSNTITTVVSSVDGLTSTTYTSTIKKLIAQTITFPALGSKATGIADFAPATTDSGLPISYSSSSTSKASIVSGKVHLVSAGSVNITASQAGNTDYAAATPVVQAMTITKGAGTITFAALTDKLVGDANYAPGATSTNTVTSITYGSSNTAVATVTGSGGSARINIKGAGTTNITASQVASTNYLASAAVIQPLIVKNSATITLSGLTTVYDGTAKAATATTQPIDLTGLTVTYDGSATAPTVAGSYAVTATLTNTDYAATPATGTLVISKATATITLADLLQNFDGTAKPVTVTTDPASLTGLTVTYDGNATVPTAIGTYAVTASLNHNNYTATTATGNLEIKKFPPTLSSVSISSSNSNTTRACIGDVITLVFTANENIPTPVVTIAGETAVVTRLTGNNWSAAYTMQATDTQGTIPFNISFTDMSGIAATAVTAGTGAVLFDTTSPTLSAVSIVSNNATTTLAKAGDEITLLFTADETIQTPVVKILSKTATVTHVTGNDWKATYIVLSNDRTGTVTFSIDVKDLTGNAGNRVSRGSGSVETDLTAPSVNTAFMLSNGTAQAYAKIGDVVTLSIYFSEVVGTPIVTIANNPIVAVNTSFNTWKVAYTVTDQDSQGLLAFNVAYKDLAGNPGTDLNSLSENWVTVDKIVPPTPQTLTGIFSDNVIKLDWLPVAASDLLAYRVFYGTSDHPTALLGDVHPSGTNYTFTNYTPGEKYYFTVAAVDIAGNVSPASMSTYIDTQLDQTFSFDAPQNIVYGSIAAFEVGQRISSGGLDVVYVAEDPTVISITGNVATILKAGSTKVTATQPGNNNYFAAPTIEQIVTVEKQPITILGPTIQRRYGDVLPFTVTGFVDGLLIDPITINVTSEGLDPLTPVGQYPIVATLNDPDNKLGNYIVTNTGGMITIDKRQISVKASNLSKEYGATDQVLSYTFQPALVGVDKFTGVLKRTAGELPGTYNISQGTLALDSNYTINYTAGDFSVIPAPLTITAASKTKFAGATNPVFTASYSGFVNSETAANLGTLPTFTTTATASSPAGTYPVMASGAVANNYSISYVPGILTVTGGAP
ncbi:MAG: MBG domain-containing protein, partial [Pelobium sp.]